MQNIDRTYLVIGLVYVLLGACHGLFMAYIGNYLYTVIHAHTVLVGGLLMLIYGGIHRLYPALREDRLAGPQFWCMNIGSPVFFIGIWIAISGITDWVGHTGSALVIIALVIFIRMVARMSPNEVSTTA